MSNDVMELEDIDGFDYASEYEDDDFGGGGGGMLAGTTRLKFTNAYEWVKEGSNEKMPVGLELLVAKIERELIRFKGEGVAPETHLLKPGEKFPNMRKYNEEHVPKAEWKLGRYSGQLEGGWQSRHVLFLLDERTLDRYSWSAPCATKGATMCIEDLQAKIKFKRKITGETVNPVVTLSDTHMKTQYSPEGRQRPHLVFTGRWVRIGGGPALAADPEPKQLTASPPTAPAAPVTSPVRVPEMGPKPVPTGEQLDNFAKAGKPVEAPAASTDLDDQIPF
jgi:hypothetical protein